MIAESSPDILDILRQKKLQDMMNEAGGAAPIEQPKYRDFSPGPGIMGPVRPLNIGEDLAPRKFEPPAIEPRKPEDQLITEAPPELKGYQNLSPETVPDILQPGKVAPFGRDIAKPPDQFQTPREVTSAQENLQRAAAVKEEPISRGRKIGAILAGIGGGFLGGPYMGMDLYGRVAHGPYNAKVESILRNQRILDHAAKLALDEQKRQQEGVKTEAEAAKDIAEEQNKRVTTQRLQQTPIPLPEYKPHTLADVAPYEQSKAQGKAAGTPGKQSDPYEIQYTDASGKPVTTYANQDSKTGAWTQGGIPLKDVQPTRVRKVGQTSDPNNPFEVSLAAFRASNNGREPQTKEEVQQVMQGAMTPEQLEAQKVKIQLDRAHISQIMHDIQTDTATPEDTAKFADLVRDNPDAISNFPPKVATQVMGAMIKKGYAIPSKLTAAAKADEEGVNTLEGQLNELEDLVKRNRRRLNPIMGHVGKLERGVGVELIPFGSDQEKKDSQAIRTLIDAIPISEAKVIGGGQRPAVKVIEMLQNMAAKSTDSKTIMEGAFQGLRSTIKARRAAIDKARYGNQQTDYVVGGVYGGKRYLGGDKNDPKNWEKEE